jgi:hypothetical protein
MLSTLASTKQIQKHTTAKSTGAIYDSDIKSQSRRKNLHVKRQLPQCEGEQHKKGIHIAKFPTLSHNGDKPHSQY